MAENKDWTERTKNLLLEWENCLCKAWNWDDCKHLLADNAKYIIGHDVFEGKEQIAMIPKMSQFLYPNGASFEVTALFGEGLIEEFYEFPDSAYCQQMFNYEGLEEYLAGSSDK